MPRAPAPSHLQCVATRLATVSPHFSSPDRRSGLRGGPSLIGRQGPQTRGREGQMELRTEVEIDAAGAKGPAPPQAVLGNPRSPQDASKSLPALALGGHRPGTGLS